MKKRYLLSFLLSLIFVCGATSFGACRPGEGTSDSVSSDSSSTSEIVDTDVGLTFTEIRTEMYVGESYQTVLSGLNEGETLTYTTNDDAVLSVDENGLIVGKAVGTAVVKASSNMGRTALIEVTILDNSMKAKAYIKLSQSEVNLLVGDTLNVSAELLYNGKVCDGAISWTSENEEVATVADGLIVAVANGSTKLVASAEYKGETITAKCTVNVSELGVIICPDYAGLRMYAGKSETLSVSVMHNNEQIMVENVEYSVSDTSIALLEGATLIARDKGGSVTVTATFIYNEQEYNFSSDVYVYGKYSVEIYASGEKDRTLRGKVYGDLITLELLNPEEGRAIKSWYVNEQKIQGNTFKMLDGDVNVTAVYVNESDDDFVGRFNPSCLLNDSNQAAASFIAGELVDKQGGKNALGGYVKLDTPNWSSAHFSFDENVKVTATAKVKMRIYVPTAAALVYMGAGDYHKTVELYNWETPTAGVEHTYKVSNDEWIDIEMPLTDFAELDTMLGGISISVSSNSYCLIDSIQIIYK